MKDWFSKFLSSNDPLYRLLRTIFQGILGVLVASLDSIFNALTIEPTFKPIIVAIVMAVLSPIMAMLGETNKEVDNGAD